MTNALLFNFTNGDTLAFKDFFDENYENSVQYIISYVKERPNADDIAATIFTRISQKVDQLTFQSKDKLVAYLYTSCHNEIINCYRKRRPGKRPRVMYDMPMDELEIEIYIEAEEIENQWIDIFYKEIELQSPVRKAVTTHYYLERKKPKEISKLLNVKPTTVYGHLEDFKNYLKAKYKNFPIDNPPLIPVLTAIILGFFQ